MTEPIVFQKSPLVQEAAAGTYYWCACGRSKAQPFCDGAHQGTGLAPVKVDLTEKRQVAWCGCKKTAHPPFCDGNHRQA